MSYIVNRTDGNIAAVVNDGVLNSTTSLKLVGRGYANYAETIAENFIALLENFSSPFAPNNPLPGQLWFSNTLEKLQIFNGVQFKLINNVNDTSTEPTNPDNGDFWYNPDLSQLFYYRDGDWELISPSYSSDQGRCELVVETYKDSNHNDHSAIALVVNDFRVAVLSYDSEYHTAPILQGFPIIKPGINIANENLITDAVLNGTATRSVTSASLEPLADALYMHANADTGTVGNLTVSNSNFTLGLNSDFIISTADIISLTAAADSMMEINGFGGGSIVFDNTSANISITNSGSTLNVAGVLNASQDFYTGGEFWLGTSNPGGGSLIQATNHTISIKPNPHGPDILFANNDGISITGDTAISNNLLVSNDINVLGNIFVNSVPTVTSQVANKDYVDSMVVNNTLPIGSVIMWYGAAAAVPNGWAICNGNDGTPDLRDRFVIGAGTSVNLGQTGGLNSVSIQTELAGAHVHTATTDASGRHNHGGSTQGHQLSVSELPAHTHTYNDLYGLRDDANPPVYDRNGVRLQAYTGWGDDGDNDSGSPIYAAFVTDASGNSDSHFHGMPDSETHTHTLTVQQNGNHQHSISFDNRPAYIGLYYIMKIVNALNPYV
jgi:hypothetical protein